MKKDTPTNNAVRRLHQYYNYIRTSIGNIRFRRNHENRWKNISLSDSICSRGFSRWKFIIPPGHKSPFYDKMHQTATLWVSPIVFILSEFTKAYPIISSGWHFIRTIITEDAIFALLHFLLPLERFNLFIQFDGWQKDIYFLHDSPKKNSYYYLIPKFAIEIILLWRDYIFLFLSNSVIISINAKNSSIHRINRIFEKYRI